MVALPDAGRTSLGAGEVLVGREAELRTLDGLLADAVAGEGRVVFLTGEPGIGKTALAGAFLRRAREDARATFCRGRCVDQYGGREAYLPFLDALGALLAGPGRGEALRLLRTHAPTWCLHLPAAAATPEEREALQRRTVGATKERMLREMVDGLSAAAAEFPLVLFLEDLQWADPSSVDTLRFLGKQLARQRILVVGTLRPGDLEAANHPLRACRVDLLTERHCQEIALSPLGPEQVAAYLDARFTGHRFPADLARSVHRRTDGHPLFVVSIVDLLVSRGDVAPEGESSWALARPLAESDRDVPESLRDMIRRKVELLPEADRTVLQAASVIGRDFLSTVLASLLEADEEALEERLLRLARAPRLVEVRGEEELPDGSLATLYRFTHGLYQEVLYEDLVSKRRTSLHLRVGQALQRHFRDDPPRVAFALAGHFERGRDFAEAVDALVQAGERSAGVYAYPEALEHFRHALRLVERLPPEDQGRPRLRVHGLRGGVLYALGSFDEAAEEFTRMREEAVRAGDPARECAALSGLCGTLFFTLRLEEMAVRAHEALGAAARTADPRLQVAALVHVAQVVEAEGRLEEALPLFGDIVAESRRLDHRPSLLAGLAYGGLALYWQSRYDAAEEAFAEAAALAETLRDGFLVLACRMHVGLCRGNRGRLGDARAVFDETIERARRNGDRLWLPRLVSQLGWMHRELQDFAGACAHDEEGLRLAREQAVKIAPETEALLNLCLDYTRAGRHDEAGRAVEELERIRAGPGGAWFGWLHELRMEAVVAEHWLIRGDLARARDHARRLGEVAERVGARAYVASARRFLARAALREGDLGAAREAAEAALAALQGCEAPLETWKVQATLGEVRARGSEAEAARAAFRKAESEVARIAARVGDEALRLTFLSSPSVRTVLEGAAGTPPGPGA